MGSVGSLNTGEEGLIDFEPVPREMKGKEAIKIVDLFKSFKVSKYLKIGYDKHGDAHRDGYCLRSCGS